MIRVFGLVLVLVFFLAPGGNAQEGASLARVEELITQGRILQAREVLEDWWAERGPDVSRSERQRSLWLRARLTVDPSLAELDLRRLVLEFPGGDFSDDALLRLAQSAESRGDLPEALGHYSALVRGYPGSPFVPLARVWIEAHGGEAEAQQAETPERTPASGAVGAGEGSAVPEALGPFAVQVGAFRSMENARSMAEQLRGAGFQPRVVRVAGDDLTRVRVGRFQLRDEAEKLQRTLIGSGFDATIVTDAQSEGRIR